MLLLPSSSNLSLHKNRKTLFWDFIENGQGFGNGRKLAFAIAGTLVGDPLNPITWVIESPWNPS